MAEKKSEKKVSVRKKSVAKTTDGTAIKKVTTKKVTKKTTTKKAAVKPKKVTAKKKVYVDLGAGLIEKLVKAQDAGKVESFLTKQDKYGYTPLMYAALYGDEKAVAAIIAAAHDEFPDASSFCNEFLLVPDAIRGWTALHCAVVRGHKQIVTLLLTDIVATAKKDNNLLYATLVPLDNRHQWNPLMFAVNRADFGMIELLLKWYRKYLTEDQLSEVVKYHDEKNEQVINYATRDDVRTLLKSYGA